MCNDTLVKIQEAELLWLDESIAFLEKVFEGHWLPSHDVEHHKRVWEHAKTFLQFFYPKNLPDVHFAEKLLLVSMFHDSGMSVTIDILHGKESKYICNEFLILQNSHLSEQDCKEVLDAIEYHDNKNYDNENPSSLTLLSLFSLADDFDAAGVMGVFRYLEIYFHRNIPLLELPEKVLINITQRKQHFKNAFERCDIPSTCFLAKFDETSHFYKQLENEYLSHEDGYASAIATILIKEVIEDKIRPERIAARYRGNPNKKIADFFRLLSKESNIEGSIR